MKPQSKDLSLIAEKHNVGLHVDCCLGGFVLPFARKLRKNIPKFDFELPGVTSMSCDTHKYGYASKGTSVVLYRSKEFRHFQYFAYPDWTGGLYVTPTVAGSRPGGLSAACWAAMMRLGEQGYLEAVEKIISTTERLCAGVKEIPGLRVIGEPVAMIVAFDSPEFNIYQVSDLMSKKGYGLSPCQNPPCVHICVTLRHADHIEDVLKALRECTATVRDNPGPAPKDGTAPIYGMASSLPGGPVKDLLRAYTDVVLKV